MIFPATHAIYPDQPKGMKEVLKEQNLWRDGLRRKCGTGKCDVGSDNPMCCARQILQTQPDFQEQTCTIQEKLENAGHSVIFLPKYHCELNFIEYFWGAVKKYLCNYTDYTFETLKKNVPIALAQVKIRNIRLWEHRVWRWINAYSEGMGAKDAQLKVKEFSSKCYTSHQRVPETLAHQFDTELVM
jgi:hypothetical protein